MWNWRTAPDVIAGDGVEVYVKDDGLVKVVDIFLELRVYDNMRAGIFLPGCRSIEDLLLTKTFNKASGMKAFPVT